MKLIKAGIIFVCPRHGSLLTNSIKRVQFSSAAAHG